MNVNFGFVESTTAEGWSPCIAESPSSNHVDDSTVRACDMCGMVKGKRRLCSRHMLLLGALVHFINAMVR